MGRGGWGSRVTLYNAHTRKEGRAEADWRTAGFWNQRTRISAGNLRTDNTGMNESCLVEALLGSRTICGGWWVWVSRQERAVRLGPHSLFGSASGP